MKNSKQPDDRSQVVPLRPRPHAMPVGLCSMWAPRQESQLESWQRGKPDPRHGPLFGL